MIQLEQLQPNAAVRGFVPDAIVVVSVQWFGSQALEPTYKTPASKVANELLNLHDEPRLVLAVPTSVVAPLPHQITTVYESMLPRQPLRFLLADDPAATPRSIVGA